FRNFRIVDAFTDMAGTVIVDGGKIAAVLPSAAVPAAEAGAVFDGHGRLALTSGFVDMHAHFREAGGEGGYSDKESLESASLAAARGGYTSAVCMANTSPAIDSVEAAEALKRRSDALGLVSLYPAVSLTEGRRGKRLSPFLEVWHAGSGYRPPLLSDDGSDIEDDGLFSAALARAAERGILVSCHCDIGGEEAAAERAVKLWVSGGAAGRLHVAHVSASGTAELIREQKRLSRNGALSAEAAPHHIALTSRDGEAAGAKTFGRVAPPLRDETHRRAVIEALRDGTIDVIATDHAPHSESDKRNGAPGFSGLETAFSVCNTALVKENGFSPQKLFSLLSAEPARLLGLDGAGAVAKGKDADIAILDMDREVVFDAERFASRGKNSLFAGKKFFGAVVFTLHGGRIAYQSPLF
ncbi:MAG: amidohydrolase family protein, partial [Spirochaetaceae bacterium]|nr:amidohydrolase family protein [Spirochaetaceae bacterium]